MYAVVVLAFGRMDTFEVTPPATLDATAIVALVERAAVEAGLLVSRSTLRTYPGSTHWHLKQPGAKGMLELTYWPQTGRLWFAVHANRRADWIAPAIEQLTARIVQDLAS